MFRNQSMWSLAFILCILLAVVPALAEDGSKYPMTITDAAGREITIQMPVERIIVQNSDAAEATIMLGAGDKIVGVVDTVAKKTEQFPSLKNKQNVGSWSNMDFEMIGEMAKKGETIVPNIIVICYTYNDKPYGVTAIQKGLAPFANITVVGLDFYKPETLKQDITILGKILGKETEAQDYINWYNGKKSDVENAVQGMSMPKVYLEMDSKGGLGALSTYGVGSGLNSQVRTAGGLNIARNINQSSPKVEWEWVVSQNPDVIIRIQSMSALGWKSSPSMDTVGLEATRNEILNRPGASSISAVKNKRVYVVYWDMLYGMDGVVGMTYLAKLLHPEVKLDPKNVYEEYLTKIGLTIPEGRSFIYPQ